MSDSAIGGYRDQIVASLTPVRPLAAPSRRVCVLVPLGLAVTAATPFFGGPRGDLGDHTMLVTWGLTGLQSLVGLWLLALGFREAVPGRNVSSRALAFAGVLTAALILAVTFATNAASPTIVAAGREWQYWRECVIGPTIAGAPLMLLATLMTARAFPTRPSIAGALCGLSAGVLADAGWRMGCWISSPAHVIGSHGLAVLGLTVAGSMLAVVVDSARWRRVTRAPRSA